jgi:hypothetical protein
MTDQMATDGSRRTAEEHWASLSREESRLESPSWHEGALKETTARCKASQEQPLDWAIAKQRLRKRAE